MTATVGMVISAAAISGDGAALLTPNGAAWDGLAETTVALQPTPLDAQPSAYVQASFAARPYGRLETAGLSIALSDTSLYVRVRWLAPDPRPAISDNNVYADACALLFPLDGRDAELSTMGSEERPVHAWHWRAGTEIPFVLNATGLGTTERLADHSVHVTAGWERSQWTVAFGRKLEASGVPLSRGTAVPMGLAVWRGSLGERAGLKSHTPEWLALKLPD